MTVFKNSNSDNIDSLKLTDSEIHCSCSSLLRVNVIFMRFSIKDFQKIILKKGKIGVRNIESTFLKYIQN